MGGGYAERDSYKNRTFNLSEDHTVMNLNERSRMGQYYRSRAKKSRVLQQKADELKSLLNRRKRNTSVEDFGTDSSNPSIEGGLAFKDWQEKTQAEKEESIRGIRNAHAICWWTKSFGGAQISPR